jgi:hypothetical protein
VAGPKRVSWASSTAASSSISARIALNEAVSAIGCRLDLAGGHIANDQPRDLRATQAGDLLDVAPQQPACGVALLLIVLLAQHQLDPAVNLLRTFALKQETLAGFDKPANRLQTQLPRFVHADLQPSVDDNNKPSGSSWVGQERFDLRLSRLYDVIHLTDLMVFGDFD